MNKKCNKCKLEKPYSEFHKNKWKTDGYSHYCKTCKAILAKEYREANPEIEKSRKARWYKNNKTHADSKNKIWISNNSSSRKEISLRYYYSNKEYYFSLSARYRASKINAVPSWANFKSITYIYEQARKMTKDSGTKYVVDHIVPLNSKLVCGLHTEANLQIITEIENLVKSNKYWPYMP